MVKAQPLRTGGTVLQHFGRPLETVYSRQGSLYLPQQDDVAHLIQSGKLIQIFGDFEASDKDARTATPRDFAALAFDVQGKLLARLHVPVMQPEHSVYTLGAALVGQIDASTLGKGYAEHMAAAQIHDFFRATSMLDVRALRLKQQGQASGKTHYLYPLRFADGKNLDLIVQPGGKKFHLGSEGKDHKVYGHWQPFNGEKYDDVLLAHWSARLGFASLFPSSRKKHDTIRSDVRVKAMWVWAFGPQGDAGLQLGTRHHKRTRRAVLGTRLEDIILHNTPEANRARGVAGGIRLYDGREFDSEKMHSSEYDTAATAALNFELRRLDPQGMRFVESLDDADQYKRFLQGQKGLADRPPIGFIHYDQGLLTRGIGALLATDDAHGDRRRALIFNLAHDPAEIMQKTTAELKALLVQRNNDPVFVPIALNKSPVVADFERAYAAGAGHGLPPEVYHRRALQLSNNRGFIQRVMESWYELTNPAPPTRVITQRPAHEDSFAHYGEPKYYVTRAGGTHRREPKDIYQRRLLVWRAQNAFDRLLLEASEGHAIEYSNDAAATTHYAARAEAVGKKLAKLQKNWTHPFTLPPLPEETLTLDGARRHLWETREASMDARFSLYPDAWVVNERGQRQPWEQVLAMPAATRQRLWPLHEDKADGQAHWRIAFERNPARGTIMTTVLAFTTDQFYQNAGKTLKPRWWDGYFAKSWAPARPWYAAYVAQAVQGPPNLDPAVHPMPSERSEHQQGQLLLQGAAGEKRGDYDRLLAAPLGQQRFAEHMARKAQRLADYPWTPERLRLMGYDADTRAPLPNPRYQVDPEAMLRITVPDAMLETAPWHPLWGRHHVIAKPETPERDQALAQLPESKVPVLLVGQATGMFRLAARAVCLRLPPGAESADAVAAARGLYAEHGAKLGAQPKLLTFEQLAPVHGARAVDETQQHVVLPAQEWAGLVDTKAGGLPPPLGVRTGILVRDVGQAFRPGPIRLRRQQGGVETGDEYSGLVIRAKRVLADDLAALPDSEAWRFGKLSASDLHAMWKKVHAELSVPADQQKLWRIELAAPVNTASYTYHNRAALPVAVFTVPLAQRPTGGKGAPATPETGVPA